MICNPIFLVRNWRSSLHVLVLKDFENMQYLIILISCKPTKGRRNVVSKPVVRQQAVQTWSSDVFFVF